MSAYSIVRADEAEDSYAAVTCPGSSARTFEKGKAGSAVRVAPSTTRSHRNEGEEPVEVWAVSRKIGDEDSVKVEDFWEPSPDASQKGESAD